MVLSLLWPIIQSLSLWIPHSHYLLNLSQSFCPHCYLLNPAFCLYCLRTAEASLSVFLTPFLSPFNPFSIFLMWLFFLKTISVHVSFRLSLTFSSSNGQKSARLQQMLFPLLGPLVSISHHHRLAPSSFCSLHKHQAACTPQRLLEVPALHPFPPKCVHVPHESTYHTSPQ